MKFYKIDQYFEMTFQTQRFDTGAATDADSTPTYRTYEENNDTVLQTGNTSKRDDANTTGYYYARDQMTTAAGYEVGKTYEVRVAATVNSVAGAAVVGRFTILPALVWDSMYGGTDNLQVDSIQVSGTSQTARDLGNALPAAVPGANGGLPTTDGTKLNQTADLTAGQTIAATVAGSVGSVAGDVGGKVLGGGGGTITGVGARAIGDTGAALATQASVNALPTAAAIVAAIDAAVVEGTITHLQAWRIMLSALAGKSSGHSTNAPVYRDTTDSKDRITATTTADGRTAVTLDGT